jgi:lincosamide nucleotidyltransferase A/C/D/E
VVTALQVLDLLSALEGIDVPAWVDGGWGVDALLGRQTRHHDDLDLVVLSDDVPAVRGLLSSQGFEAERDWLPTALAMRHVDGRAIDLHPIEPTPDGGGDQIQRDGVTRWHYDPPVNGRIGGTVVPCCSLGCQLKGHLGYEPDDDDRADMSLLARHFGVDLPAPYTDRPG